MTTSFKGKIRTRSFSPGPVVRTFGEIGQAPSAEQPVVHATTRRRASAPAVITMTRKVSGADAA